METLVHLVYIHGFQGNDTSFQSFPLHMQEKLNSRIPQNHTIRFQSSLYPTYKSVKPLSYATKNFLGWLATQPDGPVVVIGHSMGGLLAAEAATDRSNKDANGKPIRIIGVIAFDTPFIGMHPHVVISGIASLLPKCDDNKEKEGSTKTEKELNQHPQIQVVNRKVTDEWEEFKKKIKRKSPCHSTQNSYLDVPQSPTSSSASTISSAGSSTHSSETVKTRSRSPLFNKAVDFLASRSKEDDSLVRWLRKHADAPLSAGTRWITERFQFGSSMFDPSGLEDRYVNLVEWNGLWVNYWTYTVDPQHENTNQAKGAEQDKAATIVNDIAVLDSGIYETAVGRPNSPGYASDPGVATKRKRNILRKSRQSALKETKEKPSIHHFVILPTGLVSGLGGWQNWEAVTIKGVQDEVDAHTGLFIPSRNLDYEAFVDKVADKVLGWCETL